MTERSISGLPFMKMHGLGNDFVVIDRRKGGPTVTAEIVAALADRHRGVGFDQLAIMKESDDCDAAIDFLNADGSPSAACGNATRCIGRHLMGETGRSQVVLRTDRGQLVCEDAGDGLTRVNMGQPLLDWRDIPLARDVDTLHLPMDGDPVATGMGNPHCTFFVDDAESVDLLRVGPEIERHVLFPERTNVQFATLIAPDRLRVRVWERGTGVTLASGSSSCAVGVAAARRNLTVRNITIELDGGAINVEWRDDGVWMTGPTAHVFDGIFLLSNI